MKSLLLIGAVVGVLALAGTATAGSDRGASVAHDSWCTSSPFMTFCQDVWTATNETTTPSGNVSYVTNGTYGYSLSFPGTPCARSDSSAIHFHSLAKVDETHVETERFTGALTITCGALVRTCTTTYDLHIANGETQIEHGDFVCTDL